MTINLRSDYLHSRLVLRSLNVVATTKKSGVELKFPLQVLGVGENVDDIVPRLGLVDGDFSKYLKFEGTVSEIPVVVTEVGNGAYEAAFTADEAGDWSLHVLPTDIEDRHRAFEEILVSEGLIFEALAVVTYDEVQKVMYIETWGVRHGRDIIPEEMVSARADLYDHESNLLFSVESQVLESNDRFSLEHSLESLDTENSYSLTITITLGDEVIETSHSLSVPGE